VNSLVKRKSIKFDQRQTVIN